MLGSTTNKLGGNMAVDSAQFVELAEYSSIPNGAPKRF